MLRGEVSIAMKDFASADEDFALLRRPRGTRRFRTLAVGNVKRCGAKWQT